VLRTTLSVLRTVGLASLLAVLPALTSTAVASNANTQYNRGCADAKAGSYDRAHHNAEYEKGWQACKTQPQAAAAATGAPSKQEQACLAAVSNKANNGEVTVLSSEFSQANSLMLAPPVEWPTADTSTAWRRALPGPQLDGRPSWKAQTMPFIASHGTRARSSGTRRYSS
jgi:hypothetical protein